MYNDPLGIESDMSNSVPDRGWTEDGYQIDISDFLLAGATPSSLGTATGAAPFRTRVQTPFNGIRWDNAANTAGVIAQLQLPGQFSFESDALVVIPTLRYSGSGSDAAPQFQIAASYFRPGYASGLIDQTVAPTVAAGNLTLGEATVQTIQNTRTTNRQMLALNASATVDGFVQFPFDFSFGVPGKTDPGANYINKFKAQTMLTLQMFPSVAVGANNNLDLISCVLRWKRCGSLTARDARDAFDRVH